MQHEIPLSVAPPADEPPSPDPALSDPLADLVGYSTDSHKSSTTDLSLEDYLVRLGSDERQLLEDRTLAEAVVKAQVIALLDSDGPQCAPASHPTCSGN